MGLGTPYNSWKRSWNGKLPPVILATGPEQHLKEEFLKNIQDKLGPSSEKLLLYADETEPDRLAAELHSPSLFVKKSLIVLKQLGQKNGGKTGLAKHYEVISNYIEKPEKNIHLILEDHDHPYKKGRKLGSLARHIEKFNGTVIIFWEPFEDSIKTRISTITKQAGKKINPAALQLLLKKTGGKLARAEMELTKLLQLEKKELSVEDVEAISSTESSADLYQDLKQQLAGGNLDQVMEMLDNLFCEGENLYKIFSIIYSYFTTMRLLSRKVKYGKNLKSAMQELNIPTSPGIVKTHRNYLKHFRAEFPDNFFRMAYETSRRIKYYRPPCDRLALEKFLIDQLPQLTKY